MTKDEARKILALKLPEGASVEDFLQKIRAAIEKNDRITHSTTENVLFEPWTKTLGVPTSELIKILIALGVL